MRARTALRALMLTLLIAAGCAGASGTHTAVVPNLWDVEKQIDQYIASGRYNTDCTSIAGQARAFLEQRAGKASRPAIVLDIDETSLSNWPAYKANNYARITGGACDLEKGPCGLRAWQAMGRSKAIEPTLALAKRAKELGVAVFFITGRPENLREATERNLRETGYAWDALILPPDGSHFDSAADFKSAERHKLADQGYTILLTMGDQESDLKGGYAERTFKLPNPVYYLP